MKEKSPNENPKNGKSKTLFVWKPGGVMLVIFDKLLVLKTLGEVCFFAESLRILLLNWIFFSS